MALVCALRAHPIVAHLARCVGSRGVRPRFGALVAAGRRAAAQWACCHPYRGATRGAASGADCGKGVSGMESVGALILFAVLGAVICAKARVAGGAVVFSLIALM